MTERRFARDGKRYALNEFVKWYGELDGPLFWGTANDNARVNSENETEATGSKEVSHRKTSLAGAANSGRTAAAAGEVNIGIEGTLALEEAASATTTTTSTTTTTAARQCN